MKTKDRPIETLTEVISSFLDYAEIEKEEKRVLSSELKRYIEDRMKRGKWFHPMLTKFNTDWYREFYRLVDMKDPYKELKEMSNKKALELLKNLNPTDIKEIVMLTIVGNKIDFGACAKGTYDLGLMEKDVRNANKEELFIDDIDLLLLKIKNAKNVFFLLDNNGEMIFDTLLLEFISKHVNKKNIFLVAKETPLLNDVVIADLKKHKMERFGNILSIGSNCFGLHEEDVSKDFKKQFKDADLIIAKGQAYLEFFSEYNFKNIIHIARIKHEIVGNFPTLKPGMNVVMSSQRYAGKGVDYKWD